MTATDHGARAATAARRPRVVGVVAAVLGIGVAMSLAVVAGVAHDDDPVQRVQHLPRQSSLRQAAHRGVLRVGVRAHARPSPPGRPLAPEPDAYDVALAEAIGRRLGVPVEVHGLPGREQARALLLGRIDVLVAGQVALDAPAPPSAAGRPAGGGAGAADDTGTLIVARRHARAGEGLEWLRGRRVCLAEGSEHARAVRDRLHADPAPYPSAVRAASAFLAGECDALVEAPETAARWLALPEWRFYRALDVALPADGAAGPLLAQPDAASLRLLAAVVHEWRGSGAARRARERRAADLALDVALLQDGNVCH